MEAEQVERLTWDRLLTRRPEPGFVTVDLIAEMQDMPALSLKEEMPDPRPVMYLEDMRMMYAAVRAFGIRVAVETGSYTGMSAQAMRLAGANVLSIDDYSYEFTASRGPGCGIAPSALRDSIQWLVGKGVNVLAALPSHILLHPWLFLHDSDHKYANVLQELRLAYEMGAAVILCHDVRDWPEDGTGQAFQEFLAETKMEGRTHCNLGIAWRREPEPRAAEAVSFQPAGI